MKVETSGTGARHYGRTSFVVSRNTTVTTAYQDLIDFIAAGTTSEAVVTFHPSEAAHARVSDLLAREKMGDLNTGEKAELEHCTFLEHLMRLAKARARLIQKERDF